VTDRGPGIPDSERLAIFTPYFRGAHSGGTPGLGIGLYVAERFVSAHRGEIRIREAAGGGTTMSVVLPAPCNERPAAASLHPG
jgi:signal transduction histidine kinase